MIHLNSIKFACRLIYDRGLFRALDTAKTLELNEKKAFLKTNLEIGSEQYTTNIRLNASALPESTALQTIMHKLLLHDNLTKYIQSKSLEQETLTKSLQQMLIQKSSEQENRTKSIETELKLLNDVGVLICLMLVHNSLQRRL